MRFNIIIFLTLVVSTSKAQELYVFSEPASNIPAHAISVKLKEHFVATDNIYNRFSHRIMPQVFFGLSKNWMVRIGGSIANMHTAAFKYESINLYAKYRFLSKDGLHKHFRMAAFIEAAANKPPFHYDEISLMGDKSGIQAGLIATQLWHKFALSGTISNTQVFDKSRGNKDVIYVPARKYQAMQYNVATGYLLFPRKYSHYKQTNLNLYAEIIAQQTTDVASNFIDFAPAIQLIFNSNSKLNIGYRTQIAGNMQRMSNDSWLISFERTFLNALKKK
ncbi:MAG: hypothetical protein RL115_74 [Bacteroidota bacterium]|jgi:hypothetical protein